jgi:hypothetical protein
MRRRLFLLVFAASVVPADPRQEVYDLLGSMASGLSEGNPGQFLQAFDRSMKGYAELAANVRALVEQADVLSAVELVEDGGDEQHRNVTVDWLLQLADKQNSAAVTRRQQNIKIRLEKQKKKWRIVSLEPLSFFSPRVGQAILPWVPLGTAFSRLPRTENGPRVS